MAKREFLQLAHDYARKHMVAGYWWSEKIDGHRGFWDGGISRGIPKIKVPWANTEKDWRYVKQPISTGLWSRYGNVIHAPDWWLDQLPKMLLDGELWNGKRGDGNRQEISSVVKRIDPYDVDWKPLHLMVFDSPPFDTIFADGLIDNIHYHKKFEGIYRWSLFDCPKFTYYKLFKKEAKYRSVYHSLGHVLEGNEVALRLEQHELAFHGVVADAEIKAAISEISKMKGEGIMIRNPDKFYECERSYNILKVKKWKDAEAIVIGYTTGRATDKGSKLLGLMGALIVKWKGNVFELSGFTESERILTHENYASLDCVDTGTMIAREWAIENPEKECPNWITHILFPRGTEVTFKYQGLTKDGIPNPASYWRKGEKF
jgi:DNA ligase-1